MAGGRCSVHELRVERTLGQLMAAAWVALGLSLVAWLGRAEASPSFELLLAMFGLFVVLAAVAIFSRRVSLFVAAAVLVVVGLVVAGDGSLMLSLVGCGVALGLAGALDRVGLATAGVLVVAALATVMLGPPLEIPMLAAFAIAVVVGVPVLLVVRVHIDRVVFRQLAETDPRVVDEVTPDGPSAGLTRELAAAGFEPVGTLRYPLLVGQALVVDVWWDARRRCWAEVSFTGFDLTSAYGGRRLLTCARRPERTPRFPAHFAAQHVDRSLPAALAAHDHTVGVLRTAGAQADDFDHDALLALVVADTRHSIGLVAEQSLWTHVRHHLLERRPAAPLLSLQDPRLAPWRQDAADAQSE